MAASIHVRSQPIARICDAGRRVGGWGWAGYAQLVSIGADFRDRRCLIVVAAAGFMAEGVVLNTVVVDVVVAGMGALHTNGTVVRVYSNIEINEFL